MKLVMTLEALLAENYKTVERIHVILLLFVLVGRVSTSHAEQSLSEGTSICLMVLQERTGFQQVRLKTCISYLRWFSLSLSLSLSPSAPHPFTLLS